MNRNSLLYKLLKPCYDVIIDFESWVRRKPYIADVAKMLNRDTDSSYQQKVFNQN